MNNIEWIIISLLILILVIWILFFFVNRLYLKSKTKKISIILIVSISVIIGSYIIYREVNTQINNFDYSQNFYGTWNAVNTKNQESKIQVTKSEIVTGINNKKVINKYKKLESKRDSSKGIRYLIIQLLDKKNEGGPILYFYYPKENTNIVFVAQEDENNKKTILYVLDKEKKPNYNIYTKKYK